MGHPAFADAVKSPSVAGTTRGLAVNGDWPLGVQHKEEFGCKEQEQLSRQFKLELPACDSDLSHVLCTSSKIASGL